MRDTFAAMGERPPKGLTFRVRPATEVEEEGLL
jgi:hypothetical protein